VEVISQYPNQVKFSFELFFFYSFNSSDDSHQQPVQLSINEPVRFSTVAAAASPPQYFKIESTFFFEI
jgi:hypothetical protein